MSDETVVKKASTSKTVKVVVNHPKLYLAVKGKKQHIARGSELTVTEAQAERLGGKVSPLADRKKVTAD